LIVVDSTVWIDHLRDSPTRQVLRLRQIITGRLALLLVGDLVLCEVLQGLSNEREAALVERALRRFVLEPMVTPDLASKAAANDRALRARGITVRKTIGMLIGTFCIEHGHVLLHSDRDFDPMEQYLGLSVMQG
jgi:predicted nucleic acid-binding protein